MFLGQSFALQLQFTIDIIFKTTVLRKLFDISFSYKHCNFSHVCLLVRMVSKTVTRSILLYPRSQCSQGLASLPSVFVLCVFTPIEVIVGRICTKNVQHPLDPAVIMRSSHTLSAHFYSTEGLNFLDGQWVCEALGTSCLVKTNQIFIGTSFKLRLPQACKSHDRNCVKVPFTGF